MAQGRMLRKSITTSETISKLSDKFALLYTWIIPFQDDFGLVWASVNKLKWIVVPSRKSLSKREIEKFIDEITSKEFNLAKIVVIENKAWIWFPDFKDKQTLKNDRQPVTYLDGEYDWDFNDEIEQYIQKDSKWKQLEYNGIQMETTGKVSKDKLIKGKLSKGKADSKNLSFKELERFRGTLFDDSGLMVLEYFYKVGFECIEGKEKELSEWYNEIINEFEDISFKEEIKKFHLYYEDNDKKLKNIKLAWRNWLTNARKYKENYGKN